MDYRAYFYRISRLREISERSGCIRADNVGAIYLTLGLTLERTAPLLLRLNFSIRKWNPF
jgi:hypothetical protein